MEANHFDTLTRTLTALPTRRAVLQLSAGVLATLWGEDVSAAKRF
jgi:hypothetical protein